MVTQVGRMLVLRENPRMTEKSVDGQIVQVMTDTRVYLAANTNTDLGLVCLDVLTYRFGGDPPKIPFDPPLPEVCPFSKETFESTPPDHPDYVAMQATVEAAAAARRDYENEVRQADAIRRCVMERDDRNAFALMQQRSHLPGEDFMLVPVYDGHPASPLGRSA